MLLGTRTRRARRGFALVLPLALLLVAAPRTARPNCALIPAAVKLLAAEDGAVDRPFAAPGDPVTVFSDGACKAGPEFPHFSPIVAENEVTLSFEPPHYPAAPAVCGDGVQDPGEFCDDGNTTPFDGCSARCAPELTVTPSEVADCGEARCFALVFAMPDTSGVAGPFPLTGPARLQVRNLVAGQSVAEVGEIFEPKRGCNARNRTPTQFRQFTVLPPRNSFGTGLGLQLRGTVDGSGALLLPLEYGQVLASLLGVGGEGALRLLDITANLPNGLAGGNGLPGPDGGLIRIPRRGGFLRSYAFNGRPIPPLLEVTGTELVDGFGLAYGDLILGSVDFVDSVVRIARSAPSPDDPTREVVLFSLGSAPGADPAGVVLQAGLGPITISGLTMRAGAAAPLNSLKRSADSTVAVVARDEVLEAIFEPLAPVPGNQNADADSDDRVVHFVSLGNGAEFTTGQAVTEVGEPPKAATASQGSIVSFLQSEAHQGRQDYLGNGTSLDSILRVWSADPAHPACSGAPCELTASPVPLQSVDPAFPIRRRGDLPAPVVADGDATQPGRITFFAVDEIIQTGDGGTGRLSQRSPGVGTVGPSYDPAASGDGLVAAYVSEDTGLVPATPGVTWETGSFLVSVDTTTGVAVGTFDFDPGDADVPGLDLGAAGLPGDVNLQFFPSGDPLVANFFGSFSIAGGSAFNATIDFGNPATATIDALPLTDASTFFNTGPFASLTAGPPLQRPQDFGLFNFTGTSFGDVVDGTVVPDCCGGAATYDLEGPFLWQAERAVTGAQIYLVDATFPAPGPAELMSRRADGVPGNGASSAPRLDRDGSHLAFQSTSTNLVATPTAPFQQVYLATRSPFSLSLASRNGSAAGNASSFDPALAPDAAVVAFASVANNLVAGDTNLVTDVFVHDAGAGTTERVSVATSGAQGNGASGLPALSGDGSVVAFQTDATNLNGPGGDANGLPDVYLRDRVAGTTERLSIGRGGAETDGGAYSPSLDESGSLVAFVSDATNLVAADVVLPQLQQCYVLDRATGRTTLVSRSLGGVGANAPCERPLIALDGRYVGFLSEATNLHPELGPTAVPRVFLFDRVTGVSHILSAAPSTGVTGFSAGVLEQNLAVYATADPVVGGDLNGVSDIYYAVAQEGASLNPGGPFPDADGRDTILHAFDAQTRTVRNSQVPAARAAVGGIQGLVSGGVAYIVPDVPGAPLQVWQPAAGTPPVAAPLVAVEISASPEIWCAIDAAGRIQSGIGASVLAAPGDTAVQVQAHGDRCIYTTAAGELRILQGFVVTATGAPARDFQVGDEGVAFRTCEEDLTPPADLNGDTDTADCVMRFWDFEPTPPLAQLRSTERVAVPCTFPGCDPFFEPYRVTGGVLSYIREEARERDEGGSGATGFSCLPIAPAGVCDITGDRDGDDVAVEIFNLASGVAQVFPLDVDNPPEVAPFPTLAEGSTGNVLVVQLPAQVLGETFATYPPAQLVTVLVGDPDGDGVFEADGNLDPATTVVDLCQELANPTQIDADRDGMGAECDVVVVEVGGTPTVVSNDDPVTAPEPARIAGDTVCDLNASGTITRPEVDQVWRDRGTRIGRPVDRDGDGQKEPADNRDPDADGEITAVDFRLCLSLCASQPDGCVTAEPPAPDPGGGGFKSCGLGIEVLLALVPWALLRRRMRS